MKTRFARLTSFALLIAVALLCTTALPQSDAASMKERFQQMSIQAERTGLAEPCDTRSSSAATFESWPGIGGM